MATTSSSTTTSTGPADETVHGGRAAPARVSVGDRGWTDVVGWAGPWPVESRWWDAARRRRRARFQVACADGDAWLLVREDNRWFAEARYD